MVLSFEKKIFEVLKKENKEELNKLIQLITINFCESICCSKYSQNFIFLDLDTCELLMEINNNEYLQKYYDNFFEIQSIADSVKENVIKIMYETSENKENELKYEYSVISEIISKNSKIIIENINDRYVYEPMINSYNDENFRINIDFIPGNGRQIPDLLETLKEKNEINLIITDKDKKYPKNDIKESTPYNVEKKIKEDSLLHKHINIEFKNVEGLIPINTAREKSPKSFREFNTFYNENSEWIKYFDFKKGIIKNIYSTKKDKNTKKDISVISPEALEWWSKSLNEKELVERVEKMNNTEVFKNGLGINTKNLKLTKDNFKLEASKLQKKEYERICSLIYPYILVNDYGI